MSGTALQDLAEAAGILPRWQDLAGREHVTAPETQRALLAAMGIAAVSDGDAAESLNLLRKTATARLLPEEAVLAPDTPGRIPLGAVASWRLDLEDGSVVTGRAEDAVVVTVPAGLHRLSVADHRCLVIAAPERAPGVADLLGRPRAWGVTAALYGLRSQRNLGVGDYGDLAAAAEQLAELGADFLGINPVHARGAACDGISPYGPSCRTAFETRHVAVDSVPGFANSAAARRILAESEQRLDKARSGDLADYATCDSVGTAVLRTLFGEAGPSDPAFAAWRRGPGRALEWFALFEAISLHHGADWRDWPADLRSPSNPAAEVFATEHSREVGYHAWLQWLAARQLAAAQAAARDAGMGLGLYLDVAVGVRPGGADTWAAPGCFAEGVSLGAPPDAFNPAGQNWSLAPFNPAGLRAAGYRPFIDMLRAAMAHAGVIRIDHILGAQRSFWVPDAERSGGAPGSYVAYPLEPLLALIRLEAWRAGCLVVGEDLGSVPAGLRDRLAEAGLLGCAVLQFEKQDGRFRRPEDYRPATLASFGTHDTPTLRGWWCGWDIDRRHDIAGSSAEVRQQEQQERAGERCALARLLDEEHLAPEDFDPAAPPPVADDAIVAAVHKLLARAGSALVAVQLDDALDTTEQQNLPGTIDEHPNWRRRYRVAADALATDPGLRALAPLFAAPPRSTSAEKETQSWA